MLLNDALTALVGKPTYVAMRPTGIMLILSDRQAILKIGVSGPYSWMPKFSDVVSTDWRVFSPEQMAEMHHAKQAAEAAELAGDQDKAGNE